MQKLLVIFLKSVVKVHSSVGKIIMKVIPTFPFLCVVIIIVVM